MDTEKSSHVSECKENETTRGLRLNIEEKKSLENTIQKFQIFLALIETRKKQNQKIDPRPPYSIKKNSLK